MGNTTNPSIIAQPRQRQDLTGKRFGKLTILEYDPERQKWKCQCDCGNLTYKNTGHLNAGTATSCGCKQNQNLIGKRFGKLVVLEKSENRRRGHTLWICQCDCGNTCEKPTGELNGGTATSCGCSWRQPAVHEGDRFGRLTAIRPTEKRSAKAVIWECLCDCGETVFVRTTSLTSGHTISCGCVKRELDEEKDFREILAYTDNTCIEFAKGISKNRSNTSPDTGVRGVILKDGKYQAQIVFRKKRYYLGRYSRLEDAVEIRRKAEARVEEYVEAYLSGETIPSIDFDI